MRQHHRPHRGGNRRRNTAPHSIALVQARHHAPARAFMAAEQPGTGKRGAYRARNRHLADVIHRAMTADHAHHTTHQPAA